MESEMLRTVAGVTHVAYKHGNQRRATEALHGVYVDLLHHEMFIPAAQVLIALTEAITDCTDDVIYARDVCARLAERFSDFEMAENVQSAMAFVQHETAAADSVAGVRKALAYVQEFLLQVSGHPSLAFVVRRGGMRER
jgi:hypothetical protein